MKMQILYLIKFNFIPRQGKQCHRRGTISPMSEIGLENLLVFLYLHCLNVLKFSKFGKLHFILAAIEINMNLDRMAYMKYSQSL